MTYCPGKDPYPNPHTPSITFKIGLTEQWKLLGGPLSFLSSNLW